jgi:hypothetical protein
MPSTRPTPKTASGKMSRPLRSAKTDSRLKNSKVRTGRGFSVGDSTFADVKESTKGKGLSVSYYSRRDPKNTPSKPYTAAEASEDSKIKNNAGRKAMGSYAKNYFKKNSK